MHFEQDLPKIMFSEDNIKQLILSEHEHILQFEDHLRFHFDPTRAEAPVTIENKGFVPVVLHQFCASSTGDSSMPNILRKFADLFENYYWSIALGGESQWQVFRTSSRFGKEERPIPPLLERLLHGPEDSGPVTLSVLSLAREDFLLASSTGRVELVSRGMLERLANDYREHRSFEQKVRNGLTGRQPIWRV